MITFVKRVSISNLERTEAALKSFLQRNLSAPRYEHSLSTSRFCRILCDRFEENPAAGIIAGLGHDIAREIPGKEILSLVKDDFPKSALELEKTVLLHGRAGAEILKERFGILDEEVLDAIRHHTLGRPGFGRLGKILFISDYLEPLRKFIDDEFRSRVLGLTLDEMVLAVVDHSKTREKTLAAITREMYDELKRI